MANQLFNLLSGSSQNTGPLGNMQNLITQLNQFRNSIHGDPKQQVQELLNSGKMSQSQYNQLSQTATQIQRMLNGR